MENVITRRITLDDLEKLQKIGRATFEETFSESNSEENMKSYLEEGFSKEKLTAELIATDSEFYFALLKEEVIGYLKVNFGASQTELKDNKALEIERIYVSKAFHGKSVGQLLYDKAIEIAKEKGSEFGKKIQERYVFIKKMVLLNSTNTSSNWETMNRRI